MTPELPQGKNPGGGPERVGGEVVNFTNVSKPIQEFFNRQGALAQEPNQPNDHQPAAEQSPTTRQRLEDED